MAIDQRLNPIDALPTDQEVTCWLRQGDGMVGRGVAHARTFRSAAEAAAWWLDLAASTPPGIDLDLADEPMASPVAFISFPFAPDGDYELVVPKTVVGRRRGRAWLTAWGNCDRDLDEIFQGATDQPAPGPSPDFRPGGLDHQGWVEAVEQVIGRIRAGQVEKVVLAREETVSGALPTLRQIIVRLAALYPQTWTFCVKGLVGASPELLVRQDRGLISSRVLAGTIPGGPGQADLAQALSSSSKDLAEHQYAVQSVAAALCPHVTSLHVPEVPFVLSLPNVLHLASDITGAAVAGSDVIRLADAIHPSAAVCGTPTEPALGLIQELEQLDRGRYAGPVGWINARGDGEIALALRCGLVGDQEARIFAGAGIVAGSDPETEWAETAAKLLPMRQALAG